MTSRKVLSLLSKSLLSPLVEQGWDKIDARNYSIVEDGVQRAIAIDNIKSSMAGYKSVGEGTFLASLGVGYTRFHLGGTDEGVRKATVGVGATSIYGYLTVPEPAPVMRPEVFDTAVLGVEGAAEACVEAYKTQGEQLFEEWANIPLALERLRSIGRIGSWPPAEHGQFDLRMPAGNPGSEHRNMTIAELEYRTSKKD